MKYPIARLCFLLAFLLTTALPGAEPSPPNVVLIFVDDLGYGDIGPFGNTKFRTPNLDRFAAEGRKLTAFYATPVCSMSRACLLTGCYNARVSIPGVLFPNSRIGLNPDEVTIAEVLKSKGYATACIGKWHLGHLPSFLPTTQGFDSYFGIPYSNDMTIDPENAVFAADCVFREGITIDQARKETVRHKVPLMRGNKIIEYPTDQSLLTKRYTEEAIQFIRRNQDRRFFLYLPHTMVHIPLAASPEFLGNSGGGLLGDAVEELDWSVGQILQTLQELGIDQNTLVIFTSDNGAATGSSAPWRGKKASNYEGGVREPCIVRWPEKIPAGTSCDQIAGNIDLLPTLAALAGASLPFDRILDGRNISSLLFESQPGPVRDVHLYFTANQTLAGIRHKNWKLLLIPAPPRAAKKDDAAKGQKKQAPGPELYDLAGDPAETTNLIAERPELVTQLKELAEKSVAEIEANKRPAGNVAKE